MHHFDCIGVRVYTESEYACVKVSVHVRRYLTVAFPTVAKALSVGASMNTSGQDTCNGDTALLRAFESIITAFSHIN